MKLENTIYLGAVMPELEDGSLIIPLNERLFYLSLASYIDIIVRGIAPLSLPDAVANSLSYVKAYGGTEQQNVPEGYTEVEYLVADGASYIDTDYIPTPDSVIKTKIYATSTGAVFGSRWSPSPTFDTFGFIRTSSNFLAYYGRYSDTYYKSISGNVDTLFDFVFDINSVKLGNTTTSITREQFSATEPLCIGALNNMGTAGSFFNGRLYRLTITENGVVKADFVPCKRDSDSELGMYETVSGTFSTNAGTGTFTAGGTVSVSPSTPVSLVCNNGTLKTRHTSGLPLEYEQVEYLESSGGQYLDTGVILKGETLEVDCDFAFATVPDVDSVPRVVWGFMGPNALPRAALFGYQGKFSYGSNNTSSLAIFIDTNKHSSVFYASANGSSCSFMFDGYGYTGTGSPQTYTSNDLSIYLFARNNDTTGVGNWSVSRIYSGMKFKLDNVVVRDYITCRRLSDNALGMYDLVNKTFITNLGTGTFTAGSTVSDPVEVYVDGTTETLRAGSKNLFDITTSRIASIGTLQPDGSYLFYPNLVGIWSPANKIIFSGKENTVYTVSAKIKSTVNTSNVTIGFFYSDGTVSQGSPRGYFPDYTTVIATSVANKTVIGLGFYYTNTADDCYIKEMQIEQGSTATDYEPYYDGGTATCENLLSVGDYTDVQEVLSGDITRKVGIKVFDGTESWTWSSSGFVYLTISDAAPATDINKDIICTHLSCTSTAWASGNGIRWNAVGTNIILAKKTDVSSANDWKQWLADQYAAGTPVIVVYPLATASTESVAGQTLNVTSGDNVIDITQASLSGLELEAKYKKQ